MERWKAWALAWLLAATLPVLLLQAPSARGDELLANGGFEEDTSGWSANGCTLASVASPSGAGHVAEVITLGTSLCRLVYQEVLPVVAREAYELNARYAVPMPERVENLRLRISCYESDDATGEDICRHEVAATFLDDSFRPLSTGPRLMPPNARVATVVAMVQPPTAGPSVPPATVYLDDFSFTGPAAPSPTPPQTQTPLPTASPSPSPGPIASPTPSPVASPSPTAVPAATEVPVTATLSPSAPTPTPAPSAVVTNAGFEEADGDGRPLGWRKYGGELRRSAVAKREGQFAALFTSRTTSTKWAFQTVTVEGGEAYVLSGYALKNDANVQSAYLRLSWYASPDGSGRAIGSVDSTARLTDDSPDFRLLTTDPVEAPSEAASAKVRLMLDPLSEAEGKVYFDDISFEETIMPPPTQTAVPSPSSAATETPLSPPSDAGQDLALSDATPTAPVEDSQPASSPSALSPSPTVLSATLNDSEATASSRDGFPQSEVSSQETPSRTPVFLYRERRAAQPAQAGEDVAAAAGGGDGLLPILMILATTASTAAAAAAAFFVWRRSQKRARSP